MSFDDSLLEICDFFLLATGRAPGNSTALYRKLCSQRALLVAQKRRPRRYPREVKIKMSSDDHKDV